VQPRTAFHGTPRFINCFHRSPSYLEPKHFSVHTTQSYLSKIHLNIVLHLWSNVTYVKKCGSFGLVTGFIGHTTYSSYDDNSQSSTIGNSHSLQFTIAHMWSSQSAVSHQSSGTSFQQQMFPFLGFQTVLMPQPQ
jgi:hypothetical protein